MPLPSTLLSNVRSLENKLDYLKVNFTSNREMRDRSAVTLTETQLSPSVLDDAFIMAELTICQANRSSCLTGKSQGGGICIFTNDSWCNNAVRISSHCSLDVELLTVQRRPFYLPYKFTSIIIMQFIFPPVLVPRKHSGSCIAPLLSCTGCAPLTQRKSSSWQGISTKHVTGFPPFSPVCDGGIATGLLRICLATS